MRKAILALGIAIGCAEQPAPLADPEAAFRAQLGRQWELARLGAQAIPAPPPGTRADSPGTDLVPGRRPTLTFTTEPQRFGGRSFCNGYGGSFTLRGDSLDIGEIMGTAVGCDGPDSLETRFFRGFHDPVRFELRADSLVLVSSNGARLAFVPSAVAGK